MAQKIRPVFLGLLLIVIVWLVGGACHTDPLDLPVPDPQPEQPFA